MFPISPEGPRVDGSFSPPRLARMSGLTFLRLSLANGEARTGSAFSQDLPDHGGWGSSCGLVDVPLSVKAGTAPSLIHVARVLTVVYGLVLIVLAVIPRVGASGFGPSDWVLHAFAYGVFGGLLLASCPAGVGTFQGAIVAVAGAGVFGLVTEFLQLLIPYRSFEVWDIVADTGGALIVVSMMWFSLNVAGFGRWTQP